MHFTWPCAGVKVLTTERVICIESASRLEEVLQVERSHNRKVRTKSWAGSVVTPRINRRRHPGLVLCKSHIQSEPVSPPRPHFFFSFSSFLAFYHRCCSLLLQLLAALPLILSFSFSLIFLSFRSSHHPIPPATTSAPTKSSVGATLTLTSTHSWSHPIPEIRSL